MQSRAGFRHLHQRVQTLLHTRTTGSRHANKRTIICNSTAHTLHKALAHYRTHGAADKAEFKSSHHNRQAVHSAFHNDQSIVFAGCFARSSEAIRIFFAVFKFQRVCWLNIGCNLFTTFFIQKQVQTFARRKRIVMITFRADFAVLFQLG